MGEYEPDDSRDVTLSDHQAPGEPPRTGPREDEARRRAQQEQGGDASDGRAINAELARKDRADAERVRDASHQHEQAEAPGDEEELDQGPVNGS